MSAVRFEISMSLDGYVTASGVRPDEPMGDGGQVLHEWAFGDDERGRDVHADSQDTVGASIGGQLLRAGLVDEVRVHLVPVLLGSGTRLLDDAGGHIRLQITRIVEESKATHLYYRVITDS